MLFDFKLRLLFYLVIISLLRRELPHLMSMLGNVLVMLGVILHKLSISLNRFGELMKKVAKLWGRFSLSKK